MKKRVLTSACLAVTLMWSASTLSAAPRIPRPDGPPQLYHLDETAQVPVKGLLGIPDAVEEFAIRLDPELVGSNPDVLAVHLPSGLRLEAHRNRFVVYERDWKSWSGELRYPGAADAMGYAFLVYHGDVVTGLFNTDEGDFRIAATMDRGQRLARISDERSAVCPVTGEVETGQEPHRPTRPRRLAPKFSGDVSESALTRIDVMALYTKDFFAFPLSEAGLFNFVRDSIALGNDIFANSGVNAYYNLVYTGALLDTSFPPPPTGLFDAIDWLNTPTMEVAGLRDAFGADVVALYIPYIWDDPPACGVANLPLAGGGFTRGSGLFGDKAFSANRYDCGYNDYTLAHEIGHNYGMRHETDSISSPKYTWGRGYRFPPASPTKATVMGCWCVSNCVASPSAICNRIPYFSDPDLSYNGIAIGDSTHRNADVAHAEVANYAAFRPQSANTPPNATFTCSCSGRTCSFNASGSTDNGSINWYQWDFGDGTTKTGQIVSKTFAVSGAQWVHLTVTDNLGQRDLYLTTCNVP